MSLVARMGHDSERAAIIYQYEARGADAITNTIDAHVESEQSHADDFGGASGAVAPWASGTSMARGRLTGYRRSDAGTSASH
jgi:hypothetical protein